MPDGDWVLVGVDARGASDAALRYAALEASRLNLRLRLVHVVPDKVTLATMQELGVAPPPGGGRGAFDLLNAAARRVSSIVPQSRMSIGVAAGNRVARLIEEANGARLAVLGDGPRPVMDRLATAGVLTGVASRATTPVLVVPRTWRPSTAPETVLVAVRYHDTSRALVQEAFRIASGRQARIVLLHAWEVPNFGPYRSDDAEGGTARSWERGVRGQLEALGEEGRADFPDVEFDVSVEHGDPAQVLTGASKAADLLLVARRPHAFPLGQLGSTGRIVVCQSQCPVEVLPSPEQTDAAPSARPAVGVMRPA